MISLSSLKIEAASIHASIVNLILGRSAAFS